MNKLLNILVLLFPVISFAQLQPEYRNASHFMSDEPLAGIKDLRTSAEIYGLVQNEDGSYSRNSIDYFKVSQPDLALRINTNDTISAIGDFSTPAATLALDLDDDGLDEIIRVLNIGNRGFLIEIDNVLERDEPLILPVFETIGIANPSKKPILLMGQMDQIEGEELVIVFEALPETNSSVLKVEVVGLSANKDALISKGNYVVEVGETQPTFSATISDLDLSGDAEVSLLYRNSEDNMEVAVIRFLNGTAVPEVNFVYDATSSYDANISYGDFDGDIAGELAIGYTYDSLVGTSQVANVYWGYTLLSAVDGPSDADVNVFESLRIIKSEEFSIGSRDQFRNGSFQSIAGNVDFDARDELLLLMYTNNGNPSFLQFYHFDDTLNRELESAFYFLNKQTIFCSTSGAYQNEAVRLSDLDRDGRDEIVHAYYYGCRLDNVNPASGGNIAYDVYNQDQGSFIQVGETTGSLVFSSDDGSINNSFTLGDFDGDNIRAGQGRYFKRTGIQHPLIILNAPPVHFDILDDQAFDVNACYNGNFCDFSSTYFKSASTTITTATEVMSDWSISGTVTGTISGAVGEVEASVSGRYGEGFSSYNESSTTLTISTEVSAVEDDQIYATVVDYDIWEYPLFSGDTLIGHLISVRPVLTENRWFPSKSYSAFNFIPDHEVGNVLSYREYTDDRSPIGQAVRQNFVSDAFTLNQNFAASWVVNQQTFVDNGASDSWDFGVSASARGKAGKMFAGFGAELEVEVEGEYNEGAITTHSTAISEELEIAVDLGGVDESLGEVKYIVSPYCYWAFGGALVVDYAARPELPAPGAPDTWWSENYGKEVDPALILPWKYDPEKGFALQEENIKRLQSKSISFSNGSPEVGETIDIVADIHNWSLLPINQAVKVAFYLCDPSDEANRLVSPNGADFVSTNAMDARGRSLVEFSWTVPENLPNFPRIYARIDPDNELTEIHENNNVGFNILNVSTDNPNCPDPAIITNAQVFEEVSNIKVYPNPCSDFIMIETEQELKGRLKVYDLWGREIMNKTSIFPSRLQTNQLQPGSYYYVLNSINQSKSGYFIKQ